MPGNIGTPGVGQAERIVALLRSFDSGHPLLALPDLVARSGLPKSTCHRMAGELTRLGVLEKHDDERLSIGPLIWEMGLLSPREHDLRRLAAPYLQDLLTATRQIVNLFTFEDDSALLLERFSGTAVGKPIATPGDRLPLHTSAAGKVFLAHSPDTETLLEGLPLDPEGSRSGATRDALRQELELVWRRGWATTSEEHFPGAWGLAVPVPPSTDPRRVTTAVGIVALHPIKDPQRVVPALKVTAAAISRATRHRPH